MALLLYVYVWQNYLLVGEGKLIKKGYSIMPRKKKIPRNDLGIPEYEMESLARMLLPILKKYIDSEEGKKDWEEWQSRRQDRSEGVASEENV